MARYRVPDHEVNRASENTYLELCQISHDFVCTTTLRVHKRILQQRVLKLLISSDAGKCFKVSLLYFPSEFMKNCLYWSLKRRFSLATTF